jgi:hypothetical protein
MFGIGLYGLILWFRAFTHVMPGWMINVDTEANSDEASAAVFIFTAHFPQPSGAEHVPLGIQHLHGRYTVSG